MASRYKRLDGFEILNYLVLTLLIFFIVYPFYYVVINSFNGLLTHRPSFFWPENFTTTCYRIVFKDKSVVDALGMSLFRTVAGTAITITTCAFASFAMSKKYLRFRALYMVIFTIPNFFGGGIVPVYLNFRNLGMLDSVWIYILPHAFSFFYMILLLSAFRNVPESLEEAALIDGASVFKVFMQIVIPVTVPTIATVSLYAAVGQWNAWYDTMFYTSAKSLRTISSVLMRIVRENSLQDLSSDFARDPENRAYNPEGVKMATMIVATLPIIFIYPFLQKYFVKGIMIGSIKG